MINLQIFFSSWRFFLLCFLNYIVYFSVFDAFAFESCIVVFCNLTFLSSLLLLLFYFNDIQVLKCRNHLFHSCRAFPFNWISLSVFNYAAATTVVFPSFFDFKKALPFCFLLHFAPPPQLRFSFVSSISFALVGISLPIQIVQLGFPQVTESP